MTHRAERAEKIHRLGEKEANDILRPEKLGRDVAVTYQSDRSRASLLLPFHHTTRSYPPSFLHPAFCLLYSHELPYLYGSAVVVIRCYSFHCHCSVISFFITSHSPTRKTEPHFTGYFSAPALAHPAQGVATVDPNTIYRVSSLFKLLTVYLLYRVRDISFNQQMTKIRTRTGILCCQPSGSSACQ